MWPLIKHCIKALITQVKNAGACVCLVAAGGSAPTPRRHRRGHQHHPAPVPVPILVPTPSPGAGREMGAPGGKAQWPPKQSRSRDALCHLWVLRDLGTWSRDGCPTWENPQGCAGSGGCKTHQRGRCVTPGGPSRAAPMGARSKERAGAGTAAEQMRRGGPSRASAALSTSQLPGIPLIYSRSPGLTGTRVLLGWGS